MIYKPAKPWWWAFRLNRAKPTVSIIPPFNPTGARMIATNMYDTTQGWTPERNGWTDES